jgi:hypothetical protein
MTYKGYTITYEVNLDKNTIKILKIFNKNKPSNKENTTKPQTITLTLV